MNDAKDSNKGSKLTDSALVMALCATFCWTVFIIALAWSVMRYNYAKIPHDITVASSIEGIVVMGIVVSAIPFMLATLCTYRFLELGGSRSGHSNDDRKL